MNIKAKSADEQPKEARDPASSTNLPDILLDTDKKPAVVQSVFRAANILTCLSKGINSITDIAYYCELNKATVHRLLKALGESYLAIQDPISHRYYLGRSIAQIASNPYTTHAYLTTCAIKEMRRLSDITLETIFLTILVGLQYIVVHQFSSRHALRVVEETHRSGYVPAGAASKAMLSQLKTKELKIALMNIDFESKAEDNDKEKERLVAELRQTKRQGYAISRGERVTGALCIAAPIKNYILPASLNIVGPENRIQPKLSEYIQIVKNSAEQISSNIQATL